MAKHDSLMEFEEDEETGLPDRLMKDLLIKEDEGHSNQWPLSAGGTSMPPSVKSVLPRPGFCLKTKTDKNNEKIFINICTSTEVPSPKDITDEQLQAIMESGDAVNYRVPLSLGEPHSEKDNAGKECMVYDVIISEYFFDIVQKRPVMKNFLLTIVLEGLEDKYSIRLYRECRILKNRTFFGGTLLAEQTVRENPKPFIIEVDSKDINKEDDNNSLIPEPKYTIIREPVEGNVPEFLVFEVQLPKVSSARNILLDVGEDRLVLTVRPNLYHFDLDLPFTVNNDETGAQFDKETHILSITVPVTGTASF